MPHQIRNAFLLTLIAAVTLCLSQSAIAQNENQKRSFLVADSSKTRIAIIDENGKTQWETKIGPLHDLHLLPNGNVLFQKSWTQLVEFDPQNNKTVWEYDAQQSEGNTDRKIEVHAFQRLENGNTMIAESGAQRIIEVDAAGKIQHVVKLKVDHPHHHMDTRLARKLATGNYLVCHESDGTVREYDGDGEIVWEYEVPLDGKEKKDGHGVDSFGNKCYSASRLENGNTLIGTGNGHRVIEVTPEKEVVWTVGQNDLPGIQLAWVTTVQVLPSGNVVIGNCHAGPDNPQIIEVDRDKNVVWKFHDFERFGNSTTNNQVLTVNGESVGR